MRYAYALVRWVALVPDARLEFRHLFERSEFLIDTSQKKSLRVCTRAMCSTSLGLSVSYYVPHTYVSQLGSQDTYTLHSEHQLLWWYVSELATYRHAHQKQACTKQSA